MATIVDDYTTNTPKPGETPVDFVNRTIGNYYTVPFISNVIEWTRSIDEIRRTCPLYSHRACTHFYTQ